MSTKSKTRVYTKQNRSAPTKHSFYIKTFGCQMNKNDSAIIAALLSDCRHKQSVDPEVVAIGVQSLLSLNALCLLDKY